MLKIKERVHCNIAYFGMLSQRFAAICSVLQRLGKVARALAAIFRSCKYCNVARMGVFFRGCQGWVKPFNFNDLRIWKQFENINILKSLPIIIMIEKVTKIVTLLQPIAIIAKSPTWQMSTKSPKVDQMDRFWNMPNPLKLGTIVKHWNSREFAIIVKLPNDQSCDLCYHLIDLQTLSRFHLANVNTWWDILEWICKLVRYIVGNRQ